MAYATVDDLAAGWPGWQKLTDDERATADTMLKRASAQLDTMLARHRVKVDESDATQAMNLCAVCCNMVRRAMSPSYEGVQSFAQSVGSTNVSINYRPNDGSFKLTRDEEDLLGLTGRGKAFMLRPAIHNPDGSPVDGW